MKRAHHRVAGAHAADAAPSGPRLPAEGNRPRRPGTRGALPLVIALALAVGLPGCGTGEQRTPVPGATPAPKLTARGQVRPVAHARVGTIAGGVVAQMRVEVGETVREQQEIARVRGPGGTEVLVAPWDGTITSLPVQVGDTVLPGALIATVGDLSRLQIETTDVDEFIIASVRRGQAVTVSVDALDGRLLRGQVRSVALQPQRSPEGDEHYQVVIDLADVPPELRPGMTVRVDFSR